MLENAGAVALPAAEVERLVAEEDVVLSRLSEPATRKPLCAPPPDSTARPCTAEPSCPSPTRPRRRRGRHGRDEEGHSPPRQPHQAERDQYREEREHEDQVTRLGGGRLTEPPEQERRRRNTDHAGGQQCRVPVPQPQGASAHRGHDEHRHDRQRVPDREVAGDPEQVVEHRRRAVELLPAGPDARRRSVLRGRGRCTRRASREGQPSRSPATHLACARARGHRQPARRGRAPRRDASRR